VRQEVHQLSGKQFAIQIQHQIDGMFFACVHSGAPSLAVHSWIGFAAKLDSLYVTRHLPENSTWPRGGGNRPFEQE
jgi:hypothetical protein